MSERLGFLKTALLSAVVISGPMGQALAQEQNVELPAGSIWTRNLAIQTSSGCVDTVVAAGWVIPEGGERRRAALVTGINRGNRFVDWSSVYQSPNGPRVLREAENYVERNIDRLDEIAPSHCPPDRIS